MADWAPRSHTEASESNTTWTVPDGEVWKCTVLIGGEGTQLAFKDGSGFRGPAHQPTVLVGGDTLHVTQYGAYGSSQLRVAGYEVSDAIPHDPVSIGVGGSETVTVPEGETWHVNIYAKQDVSVESITHSRPQLNSDTSDTAYLYDIADFVLEAGDTVTCSGGGHIGGWKV